MTGIIIKSFGELKDIIIENLNENTVVSIKIAGEECENNGQEIGAE